MYPSSVIITSVGLVSPFAMTLEELADCLIEPKDETRDFFNMSYHNFCEINKESLNILSKDSRIMGKHSLMLIKASEDAFYKSGFDNKYKPEDMGYFASIGMIDYENEDLIPSVIKSMNEGELSYELFYKKGYREIYPLWPLSMLNNIALCQSAIRLNIKGDNVVFTPHSDSSLLSINEAIWSIANGNCKAALAGGVSEVISPLSIARYLLCNTNESRINRKTDTLKQPMAEGSVFFALENEDIKKQGLAKVIGFGSAFGFDEQRGGVATKAIELSMSDAINKANTKKIDLVLTHYNKFYEESRNEIMAIKNLLGKDIETVSVKSFVGDMLSGAGAFDCAVGICLLNDMIPKFIKKDISRNQYNCIMINAFSVEGNATSLIIERIKK